MTDIPNPRYISCTLSPEYLEVLSVLIDKEDSEFKDISIITDPNIAALFGLEPEIIQENHIWAILEIPYSTDEKQMCHFYTEWSRALCEEYPETGCGEKRG